jgi:4-oxalocrotonate tautomerase
MPVVNLKIGKITKDQKKEIIEKVTATISEVTSIPKQAFVVVIEENDADNIGVGGVQLSERHK